MRRVASRNFLRFAPVAAAAALAIASCAKRDPAGITLALSTDVIVPEDIDAVALVFTDASNGRVIGAPIVRAAAPSAAGNVVRFPSTITLQTRFEDDSAGFSTASDRRVIEAVQIAIVGLKGGTETGTAVTLRRIVTSMPTDGVHLLRVTIPYLDLGGATGDSSQLGLTSRPFSSGTLTPASVNLASFGIGGIRSVCGDDEDRVDGVCTPIGKVEGQSLPSFNARKVFGGGETGTDSDAKCFEIPECFQSGELLTITVDEKTKKCTAVAPVGDFTLALVRKPGAAGPTTPSCVTLGGQATCLAPLDSGTGYSFDGASIVLSQGICDAFREKRISGVVAGKGAACTKTPELPLCGPSSSVQNTNNSYQEAGALLVDAAASDGSAAEAGLPELFGAPSQIGADEAEVVDFIADGASYLALASPPRGTGARIVQLTARTSTDPISPSLAVEPKVGRFIRQPLQAGMPFSVQLSARNQGTDKLFRISANGNGGYSAQVSTATNVMTALPFVAVSAVYAPTAFVSLAAGNSQLCSTMGSIDEGGCTATTIPVTAVLVNADFLFVGYQNGLVKAQSFGSQPLLDPDAAGGNQGPVIGFAHTGVSAAVPDGGSPSTSGYYSARYSKDRSTFDIERIGLQSTLSFSPQSSTPIISNIPAQVWKESEGGAAPGFAALSRNGQEYFFIAASDGLRVFDPTGRRYADLSSEGTVGKIVIDGDCVLYAVRGGNTPGLYKRCFNP